MRNDVKLGFAIGGILLAVLIVYVLVVPGGSNPKQARLDNTAKKTPDGGKVTLVPVPAPQPSAPPAAPQGEFTPGAPVAASPLGEVAVDDTAEKSVEKIADPKPPAKSKDIDWSKLLNGQQLMTQTPTPADASHASQGGEGRADSHAESRTVAQATPSTPAATPAPASADSSTATTPPLAEASGTLHSSPASAEPTGAAEPALAKSSAPNLQPGGFADSPADAVVSPVSSAKDRRDEKHDSLSSPATRPSDATASSRTHKVQSNETLSTISAAAYGSANYWPAIVKANPGLDPNRMKVGQTLNLPEISSIKSADPQSASARIGPTAGPTAAAATIDTSKQYRVQPGDSLHKISVKLYGKSLLADKLYELNKQMIGEDPARLKVGQVLQLPEPPTLTATR